MQAIDDFVAGVVRVETRTEETAAGQFVTGGSVLHSSKWHKGAVLLPPAVATFCTLCSGDRCGSAIPSEMHHSCQHLILLIL